MKFFFREVSNFLSFFNAHLKKSRELTFYSEGPTYTRFLKPIIVEIQKHSNLPICYITSDVNDPIFEETTETFKVFYFNKLLAFVFAFLDAKALVMTVPDLGNYHLKRSSIAGVKHFYLFHAIVSTHMIYKKNAFHHYDAIFCVGEHHRRELRKAEELYGSLEKELISGGYCVLDQIYEDYKNYQSTRTNKSDEITCLVAPSWAPGNIMESCLEELLSHLEQNKSVKTILRPHPEFIKRWPAKFAQIQDKFKETDNIIFEVNATNSDSLYQADILITDWSGIAMEYSFGTERPVIYLDTPRKINNPHYEDLGIEPLEASIRTQIGKLLSLDQIELVNTTIDELIQNKTEYHARIIDERNKSIYNFGESSKVCAKHLIDYVESQIGKPSHEA